jgi:cation:H+ antiporter
VWDVVLFAASASLIVAAGIRLARDGDVIAAGTGLGGLWVGAILVAAATSVPELATDLSAVWQGRPELAVGDLFGSSMANMLIIAVVDLVTRHTRVLTRVAVTQLAVGTLAVCLTTVAALGMLVPGPVVAGFGWATVAVGIGYAAGMRYLHRNRPEPPFRRPEEVKAVQPRRRELRRAGGRFALSALVILLAAPLLASSTAALAGRLGISQGFAGLVLLAVTTSLPEAVVTTASVRRESYDLAVGNLLGSNCFNMAVLVPLELANGGRSILADAGPELVVAALFGVLLTGLAMLGVLDRAERVRRGIELAPLAAVLIYVVGLVLSYRIQG